VLEELPQLPVETGGCAATTGVDAGAAGAGTGAGDAGGARLGVGGDITCGGAVTARVKVVLRERPPDVAVTVIA
jgi:hypothetical protein